MFGLLALLAATGARAGVLDAIIVPSATVEIPEANSHEANFSTPVELAISADGSTVTAGGVDLHAEWLRERCQSESSVDVNTLQLLRNPHEYATPRVEAASARGDLLRVRFADGHASAFSLAALAAELGHAERGGREHLLQVNEHALPEVRVWEKNLTAPPAFEYASLAAGDAAALQQLLGQLLSVGVVLIKGVPRREGECSAMASRLSTLRATEWGTQFNVRARPDVQAAAATPAAAARQVGGGTGVKQDIAYTPKAIGMHTDNPYRYPTPDYQLLHAIDQCSCKAAGKAAPCAECQVMNYFVDGFYILELLARDDPAAFDALTHTAVRFENNGGDNSSALWFSVPHVQLRPDAEARGGRGSCRAAASCVQSIRFSAKSGGFAPPLPADELSAFYAAKRKFSALAHDAAHQIELQFEPGDLVLFDNHRLLHARGAMGPDESERFVQGCYADRDGFKLNYERLRRGSGAGARWASLDGARARDFSEMGAAYEAAVSSKLAGRLLGMLREQRGDRLGAPIDLYEHALQTATRALRAGEDEEMVVVSLLHDVTETLNPKGHGEAAAALLRPFISPRAQWLLEEHEVFQGYYYFHHLGGDRDAREALRGHAHFNATARWCDEFDQVSFDPTYPSLPLEAFEPMVERVLARAPYWWDPAHLKRAAVTG